MAKKNFPDKNNTFTVLHRFAARQVFWDFQIAPCAKKVALHFFRPYRSFATRVSQLKIWHFWIIGTERNVCICTFNRYSVITQFAKLAAGEQLCRRCIHRKLWHFKTFKSLSWKITNFELWQCCRKWAICRFPMET